MVAKTRVYFAKEAKRLFSPSALFAKRVEEKKVVIPKNVATKPSVANGRCFMIV